MRRRFKGKLGGRGVTASGYERVGRLPRYPSPRVPYWLDSPNGRNEYTHQFFRFPAKFHPPVVRWALGNYGRRGSVILDPFTGSGTAQVEALVRGISSVGIDIDPLACLIARAKAKPLNPQRLEQCLAAIEADLHPFLLSHAVVEIRPGGDISEKRFQDETADLWLPPIPNITHWFRRYVIVDLARLFRAVEAADLTRHERLFFRICVAATIRGVSNADPAPVSGLEVTTIQAMLNSTRRIAVFKEFFIKARQRIEGMRRLCSAYQLVGVKAVARVIRGDSLDMVQVLQKEPLAQRRFPLVITSPPYCSAVEYSRRHQLEMYWLGLVKDAADRVALTHSYIGRPLVRSKDWDQNLAFGIKRLDDMLNRIAQISHHKARTLRHYFSSMQQIFQALPSVLRDSGTVVCMIGDSVCCDIPVPTADYIVDLAAGQFILTTRFSYVLRNHYMQYGLWNGHGIKAEHVLVFKQRP